MDVTASEFHNDKLGDLYQEFIKGYPFVSIEDPLELHVRVYGYNPDGIDEAKAQILADFIPHRDLRITLKMEISYTDHSHLIGCRGATILMEDTGCHIHLPDSNQMTKDHKSNQVTNAASSVKAVEQARSRVREISPLLIQFTLPMLNSTFDGNPDAHHVFIENIQSNYNVHQRHHSKIYTNPKLPPH